MRALVRHFLRGLVVIVPVVITLYVVYALFTWIDSLLPFSFPGPGFAVALTLTTLIGYLASNFLTRRFFEWVDRGLARLPFVSIIYRSIKEVTDAFVGDQTKFQRPVRVRLSDETSTYFTGFLTQENVAVDDDAVEPFMMTYVMSGGVAHGRSPL